MDRLVALAVHRRYLMVGMFIAVFIGGLIAFKELNIEAYPVGRLGTPTDVAYAALYLASRSVWPCVVLHFTWNVWNPFFLGDVYGGQPGLFGGAVWAFNGEGLFGLLINGTVTLLLVRRFRAAANIGA